jgi:hypothetical protein
MFVQVTGKNLTELWFNLLVHIATGDQTHYYYPSIFSRRVYGFTEGIHFDREIMEKDFFKYSGYKRDYKLSRLRESYFNDKVKKQHTLLKSYIRQLQPRQARGLISFSEPAFDRTDRLKCLDSLYIQKSSMTTYEAMIIFRSTEIWPKTYMDFVLLEEILAGFVEKRVRCELFSCFITSGFINMHQAPTAAMMMRKYGIKAWNEPFKKSLEKWQDHFGDPKCLETIKMQWIKRVVSRTHRLFETDGINMEILIDGK